MVPKHIFFYGTLMRGFPLRRSAGIDVWVRFVAHGSIRGVLFDLGAYPAAIQAEGIVRGEVYRIVEPNRLLSQVDAIEGYVSGELKRSRYRREAVIATLDHGRQCRTWVYFYNAPLGGGGWVPSGDYRWHVARFLNARLDLT